MDKVCKSNQKYKDKLSNNKQSKNCKDNINMQVSLQDTCEPVRGDGVETLVIENLSGDEEEELDYEDDLSMNMDDAVAIMAQEEIEMEGIVIRGSYQVRRNKSDYCWNFNKGIPCKFGSKCKFIERCKYCDSPSHGVNACLKLQKKSGTNVNSNTGQTNSNSAGGVTSGNVQK